MQMPWNMARLEIIAEMSHDVRVADEQVGDVPSIGTASRPGVVKDQ
jgi:hypothetical protein